MINDKVVLTYKRKHVSSPSDPAHVKEGNTSSKSSRRIPNSGTSNELLEADDKHCFKCHVHDSNGTVVDCGSCSKASACNNPSSESTTQGRGQCVTCVEQHDATCVEQHDNAGELVQQQLQESDHSKRSESVQGFEKGLTEHSRHSSPIRELSLKDAALSKDSDLGFADSKSTFANVTLHNKEGSGFQSLDQNNTVRSYPVSIDSTERKCTALHRENSIKETFIPGEKGFPPEEKPEMVFQKMVHKESVGAPLRTFFRRAKKMKDVKQTEVRGNPKVVRGEGLASEQSSMVDAICKNEGLTDKSIELPVLGKENLNSNQSSLNLNGEDVVEKLKEDAIHDHSPGSSVKNEKGKSEISAVHRKSEISAVHRSDGSNFTIKQGEERPVEVRSNFCSNDSMKESSSEGNRKDKQFKQPKTGDVIGDVPVISSVDAVQEPVVRSISNEFSKIGDSLSNPCQSDVLSPDINPYELVSGKTTADSLYEARKPMDNTSRQNLVDPGGSSNSAIQEANGSGKGLGPLETMERRKQRVTCTSVPEVDINYMLAFNEGDTVCQMSKNSSLPDPAVPDFLREATNQTTSPQKRKFTRNIDNSVLESQWGTQASRTICMDFLGPVHTRENTIDPIKNFRSVSPISSLKGTGCVHEVQLPWQATDSNSSIYRHKQLLDDIITSSRMLNKRHDYYFANCRRYPSAWSEEELDSLWIGVRRHGRGNWNAMLCDPKLHFAGWRISDDLAERWDVEQSRLLSPPLVQPVRSLEPDHSSSSIISNRLLSNSAVDSSHRSYLPEFQSSRHETGLSLGGVYMKKEGKRTNRTPTQLSDFAVHPLAANGSLGAGSSYSYRGHQKHPPYAESGTSHQRLGKSQGRYDVAPSMLEQNSVERSPRAGHQIAALSASTNLPHWLKEVLGTPASQSEQAHLSNVSNFEHPMVSHSGDQRVIHPFSFPSEQLTPLKDARRGILKRRSANRNNPGNLGLSTLKSAESNVSDAGILDLNRSSSEAIDQSNLVILDGDASSEETISDDQSGRP